MSRHARPARADAILSVMEAILEPLVRSPKLKLYVDELTETLRREHAARMRFRQALDEDVRAEFINGEVVEHVTARDAHTATVHRVATLLRVYAQVRGAGTVRCEQALAEFTRNDYAPDVCYWRTAKAAGFRADTVVYPVPDLIVEVLSSSTERRDRGVKFEDYAAHGVGEYWIVDPDGRVIEQHVLDGAEYGLVGRHTVGATLASRVLDGFVMPVTAAFDDDANLAALWQLKPR